MDDAARRLEPGEFINAFSQQDFSLFLINWKC